MTEYNTDTYWHGVALGKRLDDLQKQVMSQERCFAAWEDLRRRVEALENRLPLNSRVDPPGCPACDGVAGTACRCAEPVTDLCACKEVTLDTGQLEKVTDSRYQRTTHYRECCNVVSPIPKPAPVPEPAWRPKMLRERLCQQQVHAPDHRTREVMLRLIDILDEHRPLGMDGKHGDLHTPTCGCDDPAPVPSCGVAQPGDVGGWYNCDRPKGHEGPHECDGVTWTDPEPDAEVIDAQIVCGVSHIIDGAMRYCDSGVGHDGEHVSEGRARRTWTDPAPVPEWRRLADAGVRNLAYTHEDPLVVVLRSLSNIANPKKDTSANLARIIAVAEAQVGDGWQVEPDLIRMCHPDRRDRCDLDCLIDALTKDGESRWTVLGGRAAAWLKSITKDGA